MENKLLQRRTQLGLTVGELSDQEDIQSNTITTLENNKGVNKEKPRAIRMLIRLGVPYKVNERGSVYINNMKEITTFKEDMVTMVYEEKHFEGLNLGNGLLQMSNGTIYYNELRDAVSQSNLEYDEFSEHFNIPLDDIVEIASGSHAVKESQELLTMLDALHIRYAYNPKDELYIKRNFKVVEDDEIVQYLAESLYTQRMNALKNKSTSTPVVKDLEKVESAPLPMILVNETPNQSPVADAKEEDVYLLDIVKSDLKKVLSSYSWSDEEAVALKQAYQVIAMQQVKDELAQL